MMIIAAIKAIEETGRIYARRFLLEVANGNERNHMAAPT
jgi:hypothetical protein